MRLAYNIGKQHHDKKEKGVVAFRRVVEINTRDLIDPNTAKSGSKPPTQFALKIPPNKRKTHSYGLVSLCHDCTATSYVNICRNARGNSTDAV